MKAILNFSLDVCQRPSIKFTAILCFSQCKVLNKSYKDSRRNASALTTISVPAEISNRCCRQVWDSVQSGILTRVNYVNRNWKPTILHKKWSFPLRVSSVNVIPAYLVTFTEEILNGKLHFLCIAMDRFENLQRTILNS